MRSHHSTIVFVATGLILASSAAFAQDDKKQSQADTPRMPGSVHKRLGELAGTWNVSIRYIIGDKQHEGKATCEAKMILGGRFLQQEYSSRFQGQPFHVLQLLGYDNARKKSIEIMMDNLGTGVLHNEGTVSDDGKVITNSGESTRSPDRKALQASHRDHLDRSRQLHARVVPTSTTAARKPRSSR